MRNTCDISSYSRMFQTKQFPSNLSISRKKEEEILLHHLGGGHRTNKMHGLNAALR